MQGLEKETRSQNPPEEVNLFNVGESYNDIPVCYCKNCLSLKVMILDENTSYCDKCGCTEIEETHIENWEKLYEQRYGKPFNENKNGREQDKWESLKREYSKGE